MSGLSSANIRWSIFAVLFVAGLLVILLIVPDRTKIAAESKEGKTVSGLFPKLEDFDIRTDNVKDPENSLAAYRQSAAKSSSMIDSVRSGFERGESKLRSKVPALKIEYNNDIKIPEVISTDMWKGRSFLTGPISARGIKRSVILKGFLKENNELLGTTEAQLDDLKVSADYKNPDGNLSYVALDQEIKGIPVFRGEVKAGFTANGEIIRVINNLAPGLDYANISPDFGDAATALKLAANNVSWDLKADELVPNDVVSTTDKVRFAGGGDFANTAEKMYFPTEPGVAVPAWRVLIWEKVNAYYVIVDAVNGTILWRKDLTDDQTQSSTYWVYSSTSNLGMAMNSPAPYFPGLTDPSSGAQGVLGSRTGVTLIGNEGPLSFNNLGWMTDGTNGTDGWTDGNAVEAGLDIDGTDGIDTSGKAVGSGRVFNFSYTPSNVAGGVESGDAVTGAPYRNGIVTNLFYLNNRYHDAMYQFGFTEAAKNFQNDNFGRGGTAGDRVTAQAQDSSGTNNANFSTPADGSRGRMQMYVFTNGSAPARDGSLDAEVVFHEHTHGLSNRLIGNGSGLTTTRSKGSGEGWSDLFSMMLLMDSSTPANSVFTTGNYVTYKCCGLSTFTQNSYYGIRRFPYAIMSSTGGPNNLPYNPLTFSDLNTVTASNGAFPCSPLIGCSGSPTEVHNAGEIWAMAGIEAWAKMAARLGNTAATQKILQFYTDGMKMSPLSPNFIQSRDSVIAAAVANGTTDDVKDIKEGFRIRGMGFTAADTGTVATEAFDTANAEITDPFSTSDASGNNNGVPEPGEKILLNIAVTNPNTGATITNVQANVNGGPNVSYGSLANNATVTHQIPYTVPFGAACGSTQVITVNVTSDLGAQTPMTRSFVLGTPVNTAEAFDGVTAPAFPAGWTATQDSGTGITWLTTATGPSSAPNSAFANDASGVNISSLETPVIAITTGSGQLKFKNKYVTEGSFDGMVLEIKIGGGSYADIIDAGGSFVSGGYNTTISNNYGSPIAGRMAWSGTSAGGYIDTVVNLPAAANGQNVQLRWRMASDTSVGATGVNIDDIQITTGYTCAPVPSNAAFDFDGDGKTDVSVFRPSSNNWFLDRSTAGFAAYSFGTAGDILTPADFTGDGKTDIAVFRPSAGSWFVLRSEDSTFYGVGFGMSGDIPAPADYDGDGKADPAVFRPSSGTWFLQQSTAGFAAVAFGSSGDQPSIGDFDGDGKADIAVYRPTNGSWYRLNSSNGSFTEIQFGASGDKIVPADYTGDGKTDIAVWRGSTGTWYILKSEDLTFYGVQFGSSGDLPAPGDYDGDGKADTVVFRPADGNWYMLRSTAGFNAEHFGTSEDKPAPGVFVF